MKEIELTAGHKRILVDAAASGHVVRNRSETVDELFRRARTEAMAELGLLRVSHSTETETIYAATEKGRGFI